MKARNEVRLLFNLSTIITADFHFSRSQLALADCDTSCDVELVFYEVEVVSTASLEVNPSPLPNPSKKRKADGPPDDQYIISNYLYATPL